MKIIDRLSHILGSRPRATSEPESHVLDPLEIRLIAEGKLEKLADFAASSRLHTPDPKGDTPLHLAARFGNLAVCDLFIRSGADPTQLNHDRNTPSDVALAEGHDLTAQLLSSLVSKSPTLEKVKESHNTLKPETTTALKGAVSEDPFFDPPQQSSEEKVKNILEGFEEAYWTEPRREELRRLWSMGVEPGQIAKKLGGHFTSGAILNEIHRLGIYSRRGKISRCPDPTRYEVMPKSIDVSAWSDERVNLLKRMWAEGLSASQISMELGGVTRNAVLSKVHRLGLSNTRGPNDERPDPTRYEVMPKSIDVSAWSDERVNLLKRMWAEGLSASQISMELGGVTRNAVLSKVHRLGLSNTRGPNDERPDPTRYEVMPKSIDVSAWSDERVNLLKRMWAEGLSASQISMELGGVTRNAVLSKVHRLGLSNERLAEIGRIENDRYGGAVAVAEQTNEGPLQKLILEPSRADASPDQVDKLDDLLFFEAEEEPEKFFDQHTGDSASGTFVALVSSSPVVSDDEDGDWNLDLSPAPIAGEGISSSTAVAVDHGAESDFLQVRNRGRQSVKRAVVQTGTRISIDPHICFTWAEEILAKGRCSLDDVDGLVAHSEGNCDLEELRINLQRNLEAAGFDLDQATGHDADLWDAVSDTSFDDLADAIEAALSRRTRLPGTQRFVMGKSDELQLLEPLMRAKQEIQLGILASETAVETILNVVDSIRDGSRDPGSVSLRAILASRPSHAETSEVMAAADALRSWHTTGRVMDGKLRREALAALEALDLSLAFHKELVRRLEQFPACRAEASQLEAEMMVFESATEQLIRQHLPYVRRFASRNVEEGEDPGDVFQVAFMGLQRSTRRFDPERGYRFLIYASYWMRQAITRWRVDEGAAIRIPVHRHEKLTKLDRALDRLDVRVGGAVSDLELAEELEWAIDDIRQLRGIPREAEYPASIDDWDNLLPEPSEADIFDQAETERIVTDALADLPERQADIIRMRFGIGRDTGMTLEEIGQLYGVTRERIRQIEAKGLDRLSHPGRKRRLHDLLGM
ncbi:sigma-70 family RNA polymerase sigma factor [Pseudotabrizicola sediminis]|uniref:sigma-70 family RNA polymerase sigma factor n=1 Tax=Pseudotabrizicola sediminis TaxID=2486418 RepID=UPI001FDA96AB|nr:sigma-70 family RNA polymerase sigma factor [Pseudotabrizicola sediminis]